MADPPAWSIRGLRYLAMAAMALLVIEYLLGIDTAAYGGFSSTSLTPALVGHQGVGYLLGAVAALLVVVAVAARQGRFLVLTLVLLAAVLGAGIAGREFLSTFHPIDSFLMGLAFIVAFIDGVALSALLRPARPAPPPTAA